jgi:hypothetical protein
MLGLESIAPTRNRSRKNLPSRNQKWTPDEDTRLHDLVQETHPMNWKAAELVFPGKTSQQLFERWTKVLNPTLHKGSWTRQEDEVIIGYVQTHGCKAWTKLSKMLPGRIGKQCRERWLNHLDPQISRDPWTPEEDQALVALHEQYGNSWAKIAAQMPSRSDNMIKNRWYSTLAKKDIKVEKEVGGEQSEKIVKFRPPPIQIEGLPCPVIEESCAGWTPSLGLTPISFNITPGASLGLISPLAPGGSPFEMISPFGKGAALMSPWGECPRNVIGAPSSLAENRAELMNLIVQQ